VDSQICEVYTDRAEICILNYNNSTNKSRFATLTQDILTDAIAHSYSAQTLSLLTLRYMLTYIEESNSAFEIITFFYYILYIPSKNYFIFIAIKKLDKIFTEIELKNQLKCCDFLS